MTSGNSGRTEHTVLVTYASVRGSTGEIARFLGDRLRHKGLHVRVAPVSENIDPLLFEAVILGSAIHNGAFLPEFTAYTDRHGVALRLRPAFLFSVGMGPALRGPLGFPLRNLTPPAVARVRQRMCALRFQPFAGVFQRPDAIGTRVVMWLLGCRIGDLRDWAAIAAWADGIADWIDVELPLARPPAVPDPAGPNAVATRDLGP
ncbi:menaquinone-dependent protoporphyrinogen oxidase [Nocardia transvalensis]|uniref:Menaquinone-dependent protoporphyrinogen oxidase n=1 Tax=Nocardia transvalensis TaxID=37333 RepID=A0A7W9UKP8_9NOCA|nr:flavodoxin domain-containing protein [Nocardia transvalensis]MBB5916711.1 menaquinone-dependent protoporphyrinogen oxidase [Nocardia transvalensis]